MQYKKHFKKLVFLLLLLTLSCSAPVACHAASDLNRNGEMLTSVSMIELIANPQKFDGQRVIISGFVRLEFEGNAIYLHEEDYRNILWKNGLALKMTLAQQKQYADRGSKYCNVIGTFHAVSPGYFSLWSGGLSNITFMGAIAPLTDKSTSSRLHEESKPLKTKSANKLKPSLTAHRAPTIVALR